MTLVLTLTVNFRLLASVHCSIILSFLFFHFHHLTLLTIYPYFLCIQHSLFGSHFLISIPPFHFSFYFQSHNLFSRERERSLITLTLKGSCGHSIMLVLELYNIQNLEMDVCYGGL